jgi:hypothetical protein
VEDQVLVWLTISSQAFMLGVRGCRDIAAALKRKTRPGRVVSLLVFRVQHLLVQNEDRSDEQQDKDDEGEETEAASG